jgi:hypothetical protein
MSPLSSQLSAAQLNHLAAQQLAAVAHEHQRSLAPITPPRRNRSLSMQSYHALMPEHAAVADLAVPEEDETALPYSAAAGELAVRADNTGRRCSIIAITPVAGRKAKCHYDPFARRRTQLYPIGLAAIPDDDSASIYSAGGASGVFARSEGHWNGEEGSSRSSRAGQMV